MIHKTKLLVTKVQSRDSRFPFNPVCLLSGQDIDSGMMWRDIPISSELFSDLCGRVGKGVIITVSIEINEEQK